MMDSRTHVVLLCGGRSAEHDVSLNSTRSILNHLDRKCFRVSIMGLDRQGRSYDPKVLREKLGISSEKSLEFPTGQGHWLGVLAGLSPPLPVVFPVLHGPFGEDGTVQGALEVLGMPYVGAGVLSSSVSMNKIHSKKVLSHAGLPVLPYVSTDRTQWKKSSNKVLARIEASLKYPLFVKPANMGSSIGVSKSYNSREVYGHVEVALKYDHLVLVEQAVDAREIEISVLGNENPIVSQAGEIIPSSEFYTYEAKYLDGQSDLLIPALLSEDQVIEIRRLALRTYEALAIEGMARIDLFLEKETLVFWVNEANTIPGFTEISMYPKLWEASNLAYPCLLEKLINLGLERYRLRQRFARMFQG